MKKRLLTLALLSVLSTSATANTFTQPQDVSVAPAVQRADLQRLSWLPVTPPNTQEIKISPSSLGLNSKDISGPVAAITLPANRGSLDITLTSLVEGKRVYAPNVLVLDEQMRPAAFYPSSYFPYEKPGVISKDRLEGSLKLTPALGQQQIYLLIYTTEKDLAQRTQLKNPAKAYAEGVGNAVPAIPDPVATHVNTGTLKLKVTAEQSGGSVMIGQVLGHSEPAAAPVVVGSTAASVAPTRSAPAAPISNEPMLNDTESYFNNGIKQAVKAGDIDKALKLMNEAERLGSSSARDTFISSVKGKG
ncbi:maltose operon protein MalM [Enterobacterales bacterium CwR94]|nr:maltose operon protein MalM [Enterobacterales bacterium CwR94]